MSIDQAREVRLGVSKTRRLCIAKRRQSGEKAV